MKISFANKLIKLLLGISGSLFLSSCHSEYLNLKIKTDGPIAWNKDSTAFAFVADIQLYKMPKGIAKFPDGGQSKTEYYDAALFYYNIKKNRLIRLFGLQELSDGKAYDHLSNTQFDISLRDSLLFFKFRVPYNDNLKYIDEEKHPGFLDSLAKIYKINIHTLKKELADTTIYTNLFAQKYDRMSSSIAKKYLSDIKYSNWGIKLKEIYPQSKSTYMDYIVLKEGNKKIRQVIIEQIISKLSDKDKNKIIDRMMKRRKHLLIEYNKSLRSYSKKSRYTDYIKYTEEVKKMLNIPSEIKPVEDKNYVLASLNNYGIKITDNFIIKEILVHDQGYDAEFELKEVDTIKIETYKKWFRNRVAYLLEHKWEVDEQTKYGKPDNAGIVTVDEINFIWEYTGLEYEDLSHNYYLKLGISYGINNKSNFFRFSVSEEHIQK